MIQLPGIPSGTIDDPEEPKPIIKDPAKRKDYDICNVEDAKKKVSYILETTGDMVATKDEMNAFLTTIMDSCLVGAATGEKERKKTGKRISNMSGWNCYLKFCSKTTDLSFPECMSDARKDDEYYPKKDEWKERAKQGCKINEERL